MKHIVLITFLVFLPILAAAEEYTKDDFAFGYILEIDDQGAIYSVSLPHEVYTGTVMSDLEDLRVFNSEGQIVPHELRFPTPTEDTLDSEISLPFFPIYSGSDQTDSDLSMTIETGSDGEIVNIERNRITAEETPSAYLIDMDDAGPYPLILNLKWDAQWPGALIPVVLDSSADLVLWRRVKNTTLADLIFMNNRLQHDEIELARFSGRYLRLKSDNRATLPDITAVGSISGRKSTLKKRWIQLPHSQLKEDGRTYLQAEISGVLPVDGLDIQFNQPNSLLKTRVLSLDTQDIWRNRGEGIFYQLTNNGDELHNDPLPIQRQKISTLRLEILEDGTGGGTETIDLQVSYVPQEILFIARGQGPFTLAYGNGRMQGDMPKKSGSLLQGLAGNDLQNLLREAIVREKVILGGEKMLEIRKEKPWKKIILWLALVIGVATLAFMAWSLTRTMNT